MDGTRDATAFADAAVQSMRGTRVGLRDSSR